MSYEETLKVISYYAREAKDYDKLHEDPYWSLLYDGLTWAQIDPCLPREGLILDAGGGTGKWATRMAGSRPDLEIVLLDISSDMLEVARSKLSGAGLRERVSLVRADICAMPFRPDAFDFALAEGDPISYCEDPDKAVKELYRVLRPGCYVQAGVDSLFSIVRSLVARGKIEEAWRVLEEGMFRSSWGFRWWVFTPGSLRELFERAGFRVIRLVGKPVVSSRSEELMKAIEDPEKARRLLEIELRLCSEPSLIGLGGHLHVVAVKPRAPGNPP